MEHRDGIDRWLFDNIGVMPGCCASQESLRYNTARDVAERLWLTWEDMFDIYNITRRYLVELNEGPVEKFPSGTSEMYEEVLRRYRSTRTGGGRNL